LKNCHKSVTFIVHNSIITFRAYALDSGIVIFVGGNLRCIYAVY